MSSEVSCGKEKEIQRFNVRYLTLLTERCLKECGRVVSLIQFPVFKKFVDERLKKDVGYYSLCLDLAEELYEAGCNASDEDIENLLEETKEIDRKFIRAISHLPLRLTMEYDEIKNFRKERTILLLDLYLQLLKVGDEDTTYKEMVKGAYKKNDYIELNDNLLDLYAEEIFIINNSLRSLIPMDVNTLSHRLFCTMQDMGRKLNREVADEIYN
jgi:hypothetical protein